MSEGVAVVEPPYIEIAEQLRDGNVIPFLGAGANFGVRQPGDKFDERIPKVLPSGTELSYVLAKRCSFPSLDDHIRTDLPRVASFFVDSVARRDLRRRLHDIFDHDYIPCDIHNYLTAVPRPLLVVTTNYDDLMERAFLKVGKPYDVVYYPTDRTDLAGSVFRWQHGHPEPKPVKVNDLNIDLDNTNVIYKMHGTVARGRSRSKLDSYVITEDDYVEFLSRMADQKAIPQQFLRWFRFRHFLFLGYGLRDWNFRVLLRNLQNIRPALVPDELDGDDEAELDLESIDDEITSWTIQFQPPPEEVHLWQKRRVKIYDMDINTFSQRLREATPTPASPTPATTGEAPMPTLVGPT